MIADDTAALAAMVKQFNDAWQAGAAAIVGIVPAVRYPGVIDDSPPEGNVYWARWSNSIAVQDQMTHRSGNIRRYHTRGNIFIQVFAPIRHANQSLDKCGKLAMLARDAYRGKRSTGGITYHYCRVQNIDPDGKFYQRNAVIEYRYDVEG